MSTQPRDPREECHGRRVRRCLSALGVASSLALGATGCTWDRYYLFTPPPAPPGPAETLILRGDHLEAEKLPTDGKGAAELAGAHDLYRRADYGTAEKVYRSLADNKKNAPQVAEEARYYEAECLRQQEKYPKAGDVYHQMVTDFPSGAHREQAVERMNEIAQYWLEDTRAEIRAEKERRDGKHWFVMPAAFMHLETAKPLFDEEGRALEKLDQVVLNDINGKRADEALFLAGSVKFYREDYAEADRYFSQLVELHPNSPLASQAIERAIICKHMSTGGPEYDGRKTAEARKLVDTALRNYPDLAAQKNAFLERQLAGINQQQAQKDFNTAEFYRRTSHPGSAYFYYEVVRRRYPGTPLADKATQCMHDLKIKVAHETGKPGPAVPPAPGSAPPSGSAPAAPKTDAGDGLEVTPAPRLVPPGPNGGK